MQTEIQFIGDYIDASENKANFQHAVADPALVDQRNLIG
jgi:hypothetical protein